MIDVTVLDRQPAVRAGIDAALREQPDLAPAGSAADVRELWPLLYRMDPDVVVLDHGPGAGDGLAACLRIKSQPLGPRVVIYAAGAARAAIVPATLAGADAIVGKDADLAELLGAIRAVAAGDRVLPAITPALQRPAAARLSREDRAIFAMRLSGARPREIAATIGLGRAELGARLAAIVALLGGRGLAATA